MDGITEERSPVINRGSFFNGIVLAVTRLPAIVASGLRRSMPREPSVSRAQFQISLQEGIGGQTSLNFSALR
jgi:hypothetical protein